MNTEQENNAAKDWHWIVGEKGRNAALPRTGQVVGVRGLPEVCGRIDAISVDDAGLCVHIAGHGWADWETCEVL